LAAEAESPSCIVMQYVGRQRSGQSADKLWASSQGLGDDLGSRRPIIDNEPIGAGTKGRRRHSAGQ